MHIGIERWEESSFDFCLMGHAFVSRQFIKSSIIRFKLLVYCGWQNLTLLLHFFVLGDFNDSFGLTVAYSWSLTGLIEGAIVRSLIDKLVTKSRSVVSKNPNLERSVIRYHFVLVFCNFAHFFIVCFLKLFNPLCTKKTNIKRHMILLRTM